MQEEIQAYLMLKYGSSLAISGINCEIIESRFISIVVFLTHRKRFRIQFFVCRFLIAFFAACKERCFAIFQVSYLQRFQKGSSPSFARYTQKPVVFTSTRLL